MNRPNFFCDIDSLDHLAEMDIDGDHKDIPLTMDLIEIPTLLIYTADEENWTLRAVQRGILSVHDGQGTEIGKVVINKKSGEGNAEAKGESPENMVVFFHACQNLSYYMQNNDLAETFAGLDPEKEGILLYMDGDELKYKAVSGKERPDLMYYPFLGAPVMGRPYMEDILEGRMREGMSLEEKIKRAETGDMGCMNELVKLYTYGDEETDADPEKAIYWIRKMAEAGDANGMYNLGLHLAKGYGAARDLEQAAYWMERAAGAGDKDAKLLAPKYRQAAADRTLAADGDAAAQGRLAGFYMFMTNSLKQAGSEEDYKESLKWARLAAEQGNGDGFWTLALAYEYGRGVEKNKGTAVEYYRRGAETGHARSLNSLGCAAAEQNKKMAYELFLRAALLGDGEAMQNLGRCYQYDYGCGFSMRKAIFWYKKALERIQDEELERKVEAFETMPHMEEEESDADGELTAEEQALIAKIDGVLPEEVKETAKDPDSVFAGAAFGNERSEDSEGEGVKDEVADGNDAEDEDADGSEEIGGHRLPDGYMEALEAFMALDE